MPVTFIGEKKGRAIKYEAGQKIGVHSYLRDIPVEAGKRRHALFICGHCGTEFTASIKDIKADKTHSCGCLNTFEKRSERSVTHGHAKGRKSSPEHATWCRIKNRCFNEKVPEYPNYGGRGITMCEEWQLSFGAFLKHIGARPSNSHSIDRIDVNGNYEPGNVRWATKKEQARNRRNSLFVTFLGERRNLKELCDCRGWDYRTMHRRIFEQKIDSEIALATPIRKFLRNRSNFISHSFGHVN